MGKLVFPLLLVVAVIALISTQCTLLSQWYVWGVKPELLPPLLLYAAFTVNLPLSLMFAMLAATLYDSFSGGRFGASLIPYILATSLYCSLRPIFFRNRIFTQAASGFIFGWIALFLQWILCGKAPIGWHLVLQKITRLSLFCGVLAICYFAVLDFIAKSLGQEPGRFDKEG